MRTLSGVIRGPGGAGSVVILEAISGMAGVGKTAVAVHAAGELADHFPAGQFYLDMRAHSAGQKTLTPKAALGTLLRLMGIPAGSTPVGLEERVSLWRTMLADRRALIVLDDVSDPAQVRPLLPGASPSLFIITSRRHLVGLPYAHHVPLDVLTQEDAIELFRKFAGEDRTQDLEEVTRIVQLAGYLPLAIELVANRFNTRPSWTPATLSERLTRGPGRLREIRDGYEEMARAFDVSYQTLTSGQQRTFRRLGLHPGPDFSVDSAAALLGLKPEDTELLIETLITCHLIRELKPERYGFHDLLHEYARTLALSEDSDRDREPALLRLIDFYTAAATHVDGLAYPRRLRLFTRHTAGPAQIRSCRDSEDAMAWFTTELGNLLAVEEYARTHGSPDRAAQLADVLAEFLDDDCHWGDADIMHRNAVDHLNNGNDQRALCQALLNLSTTRTNTGRYREAVESSDHALRIARRTGDSMAEAEALRILGILRWNLGDSHEALQLHKEALEITKKSGSRWDRARCQNNIAISLLSLGDLENALEHFHAALAGFRATGDTRGLTRTLNNIGDLHVHTGDLTSARKTFEASLALAESTGNQYAQATVRTNLADVLSESGNIESALTMYEEALRDFRALSDRKSQANVLNGLGDTHRRTGANDEAADLHLKALHIARGIGATHEETHAQRGLGAAELGMGQLRAAADHVQTAIVTAHRTHDLDEEARAQSTLAEVRLAEGAINDARALLEQAFETMRARDLREADRIRNRMNEIAHLDHM